MIVYPAQDLSRLALQLSTPTRDVLVSYWGIKTATPEQVGYLKALRSRGGRVFVDSGGFVARKSGVEISVARYAEWLLANRPAWDYCANLDVRSREETDRNFRHLTDAGLKPWPVYHLQTFEAGVVSSLEGFLDLGGPVALGGMVGVGTVRVRRFLNYCFSRRPDLPRYHGFGMTNGDLVREFPFYSVDSSSWAMNRWGKFLYYDRRTVRAKQERIRPNYETQLQEKRALGDYSFLADQLTRYWAARGVNWEDETTPPDSLFGQEG